MKSFHNLAKSRTFYWVIFSALLVVLTWTPCILSVDIQDAQNGTQTNATKITARKVIYSHRNNKINFIDNVDVRTKDFQLACQRLVAYLKDTESGGSGDKKNREETPSMDIEQSLNKTVAHKNVHIKMDQRSAKCPQAIYLHKQDLLTLKKGVTLKEDSNIIRAETVRIYLDENRMEILSSKKEQVQALIFSNSNASQNSE